MITPLTFTRITKYGRKTVIITFKSPMVSAKFLRYSERPSYLYINIDDKGNDVDVQVKKMYNRINKFLA